MRNENDPLEIASAESDLETALRSLPPRAGRVDPVAAAFAAGRRVQRRQLHIWQAAAAVMLGVATASWMIPTAQRGTTGAGPALSVPIAEVAAPPLASIPQWQPLAPQSVLLLNRAVSEGGLRALPVSQLPVSRAIRIEELF